jgi:NitT/TauT family transport system ATP-binding protein
VSIAGRSPADYARQHLLGVAFQQHTLLPWLSVYENVALPFKVARRPVDHGRIRDLLATVGMDRFARLRSGQLSGGMCQRAAIAQALALSPEVLLLDEPFGALDAVARKNLNIELQRIWRTNRVTAVLVTHSVDEAVFLADRVIVLSARPGRVVTEMRIDFPRPRTAELFRDGAFNVLTGKIEEKLIPEDSVDDR